MTWEFTKDRPIYTQLVEQIKMRIFSGRWDIDERLPTVRELAVAAGVNPNTVQRAFAELEREEIIYTERTTGRFITGDAAALNKQKKAAAVLQIENFLGTMADLGYDKQATLEVLTLFVKEGN